VQSVADAGMAWRVNLHRRTVVAKIWPAGRCLRWIARALVALGVARARPVACTHAPLPLPPLEAAPSMLALCHLRGRGERLVPDSLAAFGVTASTPCVEIHVRVVV
jgi:hypothetical protein